MALRSAKRYAREDLSKHAYLPPKRPGGGGSAEIANDQSKIKGKTKAARRKAEIAKPLSSRLLSGSARTLTLLPECTSLAPAILISAIKVALPSCLRYGP